MAAGAEPLSLADSCFEEEGGVAVVGSPAQSLASLAKGSQECMAPQCTEPAKLKQRWCPGHTTHFNALKSNAKRQGFHFVLLGGPSRTKVNFGHGQGNQLRWIPDHLGQVVWVPSKPIPLTVTKRGYIAIGCYRVLASF